MKGGRAKAKANAAQGIREMVEIASGKRFRENRKEKHSGDAANGWYYYTTRFAVPIYGNEVKTENYNIYSGCLVVNCTEKGKMYLYDLVNIKKKRVTHSGLTDSQVVQNRLFLINRILSDRENVNLIMLFLQYFLLEDLFF